MKRHSTDTVSLVFGLIFAAIAGGWLATTLVGDGSPIPVGWIAVGTLIAIGVVGVVSSVRRKPPAATGGEPPADAPTVDPTGHH